MELSCFLGIASGSSFTRSALVLLMVRKRGSESRPGLVMETKHLSEGLSSGLEEEEDGFVSSGLLGPIF